MIIPRKRVNPIEWLSQGAPLISLALMLALPALFAQAPGDARQIAARTAAIEHAFKSVPWRIGDWTAEDVPVPPAALEILNSNMVLSRRFTRLRDGLPVTMLIVHCSDARDMQGHYPPVCYPSNGWVEDESEPNFAHAVLVDGLPVEVRVYRFSRLDSWGIKQTLRVLNYFVLPDGQTASDYNVVTQLGRKYALSVQGIGQVQLVVSGDLTLEDATQAASELLAGVGPVLEALGQGEQ